MMYLPQDYISDLNVRMSHHSTALEGNTLTLDETRTLLLEGKSPNRSVELREIYEIKSNARALEEVLKSLWTNEHFSELLVLRLHYFIGESTVTFPGEYKKVNNYMVGSDFQTTPANRVPFIMSQWIDGVKSDLETVEAEEFFYHLAKSHIEFEKIHPFSDGNGRTGRMIMVFQCFKYGIIPPVIPVQSKSEYLAFLRTENAKDFGKWLKELSEIEGERLRGFKGF